MWHLTVLSALILVDFCIGGPQQPMDVGDDAYVEEQIPPIFGTDAPDTDPDLDLATIALPSMASPGRFRDPPKDEEDEDEEDEYYKYYAANYYAAKNRSRGCICVPHVQCKDGAITDDGAGVIDIKSDPTEKASLESISDSWEWSDDSYICCEPPKEIKIPKPNGCGRMNSHGVGTRVPYKNDKHALFGSFPWMVAVLTKKPMEQNSRLLVKTFQCGGSLIHPQAVLTSASCVFGKNAELLAIRAGQTDTESENKAYPHQDRDIGEVIIHEKFNPKTLYNDFAILILSSPVELTQHINTVCLPHPYEIFLGSYALAIGWGKDDIGKANKFNTKLRTIELSIISHDECQDRLRATRVGPYFVLNPSFICAASENDKDTCIGDGGGPLVRPVVNRQLVQTGIVSWGVGCEGNGIPGVYADVLGARPWIDEKMTSRNLGTDSYTE